MLERTNLKQPQASDYVLDQEVVVPGDSAHPDVLFSEEVWPVDGLLKSPAGRGSLRLDFKRLPLRWRLRAKELVFYRLYPGHPSLVKNGLSGLNKPAAPATARNVLTGLVKVAEWEAKRNPGPIEGWCRVHADDFVAFLLDRYSPSSAHQFVGVYRWLHTYHRVLTSGGIANEPWPQEMSNTHIVGHKVDSSRMKTPVMDIETWGRNVSAAWHFIETVGDELLDYRELFLGPVPRTCKSLSAEDQLAVALNLPAFPRSVMPHDSSIPTQLNGVLVKVLVSRRTGAASSFNDTQWAAIRRKSKVSPSYEDYLPEIAEALGAEAPGQRLNNLRFRDFLAYLNHLQTACYIVISAFTAMRDSEIRGLKRGCIVRHYGISALTSKKVKRDRTDLDHYWWISTPVERAIRVMERLTYPAVMLFDHKSERGLEPFRDLLPHHLSRYSFEEFVAFCNLPDNGLSLPEMSLPINARIMRRTMSQLIGRAEDGQIALAIQLKHATPSTIANSLTSAYAEPDPGWTRALKRATPHQIITGEIAQNSNNTCPPITGPGSDRTVEKLKPNGTPLVGDPRTLKRWLEDRFPDLRLGTFNHCLGDASVAACLTPAQRQTGAKPNPSMCAPSECRNAICTPNQQSVIASELKMVEDLRKRRNVRPNVAANLKARARELRKLLEARNDESTDQPG